MKKENKKEEEKLIVNKKEETQKEEKLKRIPSPKTRVTISDQKEADEEKIEEKMDGKRKRMQSSVAEIPKRKRIIVNSTSSEKEETSSSEMNTSGSEEVFEPKGPRFRVRGPWNKRAIIEFKGKKSHSECKFEEDDFDVLHANMSRAEILRIAASTPECLDCLD